MQLEPWHAWIIAGVVLLIVEVVTPGFVVACFGVGCLVAGLVSPLGVGLGSEIAVFCVASLAMLLGIRPIVARHLTPKGGGLKTNVDALVGKRGLVTEAMTTHIEQYTGVPVVTLTYDGTSRNINEKIRPYIKYPRSSIRSGT